MQVSRMALNKRVLNPKCFRFYFLNPPKSRIFTSTTAAMASLAAPMQSSTSALLLLLLPWLLLPAAAAPPPTRSLRVASMAAARTSVLTLNLHTPPSDMARAMSASGSPDAPCSTSGTP